MRTRADDGRCGGALMALSAAVGAHHSFAMYDQTTTKTMTGKLTRYIPGANHAQLIFHLLDEAGKPVMKEGKPVTWGVETGSATAMGRQGITPDTLPGGHDPHRAAVSACATAATSARWPACWSTAAPRCPRAVARRKPASE